MRQALVLAAAVLLVSGCKGNGYAVDITVHVGSSISQSTIDDIKKLSVQVSGAEKFNASYDATPALRSRTTHLIYRPGLKKPGTDTFTVVAISSKSTIAAVGSGSVAIQPGGSTALSITIGDEFTIVDGGLPGDGGPGDGGTGPDLLPTPKPVGAACTAGVDVCSSGNCVDGVCCNTACADACVACNLPGSVGTCTPITGGNTPIHGSCPMLAPDDINKPCSTDGTCDGNGQCHVYPANTPCGAAVCDPSSNVFTPAKLCDGAGRCIQPTAYNCNPYKCNGTTTCWNTCTAPTQTTQCSGTNSCVNSSCGLLPQGRQCTATSQCDTGLYCVDGYCCNSKCQGQCEACDADPQSLGTCKPLPANSQPHLAAGYRTACKGDASNCHGYCNGVDTPTARASCFYPGSDGNPVGCRSQTCSIINSAPTITSAATCDSATGTCPLVQNACTTYAHTNTSCDAGGVSCAYSCQSCYSNCGSGNSCYQDICGDAANCGSCGYACPMTGSVCSGGSCGCPAGQTACGAANTCYTPTAGECCTPGNTGNGQDGACACQRGACGQTTPICYGNPIRCIYICDWWYYDCGNACCTNCFPVLLDSRYNPGTSNCNKANEVCKTNLATHTSYIEYGCDI